MSFKYYLSVPWHLLVYLFICVYIYARDYYMSYRCDLSFIFIFIIINHIISLKHMRLFFFAHLIFSSQKLSSRVLLSFCLIFCQFQPGVASKSSTHKKGVYTKISMKIAKFPDFFLTPNHV